MKIGVITGNDLTLAGGGKIRINGITRYVATTHGFEVTIFSPGDLPPELKNKVKHVRIGHLMLPPQFYYIFSELFPHLMWPLKPIGLYFAKKLAIKEFDILHCHQHSLTGIALNLRCKGKPLVLFDAHGLIETEIKEQLPWQTRHKYPLLLRWEKELFRKADGIAVDADSFKDYVVEHFGVEESKVFVIPVGVNLEMFERSIDEDMTDRLISSFDAEGKKIVLYMGGITEMHGPFDVVKAMPLMNRQIDASKVVLIIIGEGHFVPLIRQYIKKNSLTNVIVTGSRTPYQYLPEYLSIADVLVVPYVKIKQNEVFGLTKLLEYLASGKPVVATDLASTRELIKDGRTGILVEAGNPVSIAEGILRVLRDETLGNYIGERGKRLINENFSWKKSAEKAVEAYKTLLDRKR